MGRQTVRLVVVAMVVVACGTVGQPSPTPPSAPPAGTAPASASEATPTTTAPTPSAATTPPPSPTTTAPSVTAAPSVPSGRIFDVDLSLEPFVEGLPPLILVTHAGDGSGLLYAVGQNGVISVASPDGEVQLEPFLDIDARVLTGGEQGLLGLAFHPDYETNGRFFVNYTANNRDTVVSEFTAVPSGTGPLLADPDSERNLITQQDPFPNHNGGMLAFGPDGYLYIGMGDGGGGGDPLAAGQALGRIFGKMLRIDVDTGDPYGIPADNPFAAGGGRAEIWSLGWRNPWRFSFDRETGAMFVGDVGQGAREEIDAEPAGVGGRNYGWSIMEGDICFDVPCDTDGLTFPVAVNRRSGGECAITGGYVYRGTVYPELYGAYVFSDFCTGTLWALDAETAVTTGEAETQVLGEAAFGPSSFGEDEAGELFAVNLSGEIHRLVATPR